MDKVFYYHIKNKVRDPREFYDYTNFVLGARSGTSLFSRCLFLTMPARWMTTSEIPCKSLEPFKLMSDVASYYKSPLFSSYMKGVAEFYNRRAFEFGKCAHLDFVLEWLWRTYRPCRFIVLDRPVEDEINSWISSRKAKEVQAVTSKGWFLVNLYSEDPNECVRRWCTYRRTERAKFFENHPNVPVLTLEFDDLMDDVVDTVGKACDFVGLRHDEADHAIWKAAKNKRWRR